MPAAIATMRRSAHIGGAEPVARLRTYLIGAKLWDKEQEEKLLHECNRAVETAAGEYLATPPLPPAAMFDHSFAQIPADLARQREAACAHTGSAA